MFLKSIFLFFPLFFFGQEDDQISSILYSSLSNEEKITCIDDIFDNWTKSQLHLKLENNGDLYSNWLVDIGENQMAIEIMMQIINNQYNIAKIDTLKRQKRLLNLGKVQYQQKLYVESINSFEQILVLNSSNRIAANAYSQLGRCYKKKGDYQNAVLYFKIATKKLEEVEDLRNLLVTYINMSQTYRLSGSSEEYETSLESLQKADSISSIIPTPKNYQYYIQMCLGDAYNYHETLDIEKALKYYQNALEIAKQDNHKKKISEIYGRIGKLYNTTNPDLALIYQEKALSTSLSNDSTSFFLGNMATSYSKMIKSDYTAAVDNYKEAISYLIGEESLNSIQNSDSFFKTKKKFFLLNVTKSTAFAYLKLYNVSKNKEDLKNSIHFFMLADQVIDVIRIESREMQSKLFWREQSSEVYGKAITACYLAGDTEKAFYFMEKNKALLLTEDIKKQQLQRSLSVPDSLIAQEISVRKKIYSLKKSLSPNRDSIANVLLKEDRKLKHVQEKIQKIDTSYSILQTESAVRSLSDIQKPLDQNQVILMYNISQYDDYSKITPENEYTPVIPNCEYGVKTIHTSYGMLITAETAKLFEIPDSGTLQEEVKQLVTSMKRPFETQQDREDYTQSSYAIYKKLVPDVSFQELISARKLRIVPDNYLYFLPFEALHTDASRNAKYWLEENEISYTYSNSFLSQIDSSKKEKSVSFAGFAPVNFTENGLQSLENSAAEVKNSSNYFSGMTFIGAEATKAKFLKELSQKDIIHLATHADAQDSIAPWIIFRKEKILQDELTLTSNNAELVVLSGCKTSLGTYETGEGVMSLARGFFHSGARSVISSLWEVNDRSTSMLMQDFYKNLSSGQPKSEALQHAKLNYIKENPQSKIAPYYWASFVLLGDDSALPANSNVNLWWLLLLIIPSLSYFYWRFFKK